VTWTPAGVGVGRVGVGVVRLILRPEMRRDAKKNGGGRTLVLVRNMVHVVLYGADKAVIVYIVHSELYRIMILNNNYNYHSIDITASALYS
jgi:hypothetical protein